MAGFTKLDRADIDAACEAFGVGPAIDFEEIEAGTINSNYAIRTSSGPLFLRVNEGKRERDVIYEAELVAELAARGVSTPPPHRARDGRPFAVLRDRYLSLFAWVDGVHRGPGSVSVSDARSVGRALARLHTAGLDLAGRFNRSGIYTFENIVERLRGFADTQDPELVDAVALLLDEAQWLSARQPIRDRARRGIIHGDLFRDNVMFAGDVVVGLIDFEQASVGSLAYDLAVTINDWCFSDGFEPDRIDALLDGYRETGTVTPADHAALQVELRAAAMRFAVTRITDVYLPGVDLPDKDFRRYVDRLLALRAGT